MQNLLTIFQQNINAVDFMSNARLNKSPFKLCKANNALNNWALVISQKSVVDNVLDCQSRVSKYDTLLLHSVR